MTLRQNIVDADGKNKHCNYVNALFSSPYFMFKVGEVFTVGRVVEPSHVYEVCCHWENEVFFSFFFFFFGEKG